MLTVILCLATILLLYVYFSRPYSYWKKKGVPQWNPRLFLGDLWSTILKKESMEEFMTKLYNSPEKRYLGLYQFEKPTLYVKDLELIKKICLKDFDHFVDHKRYLPPGNDPLWDNTLFSLEGEKWREMRSVLSPSFTSSKLKSMFNLVQDCAQNFTNYFSNQNSDIIEVELKDAFTRYGADVIATIAFGIQVDSMTDPENELRVRGKEATDFTGFLNGLKLSGNLFVPRLYKIFKISLFSKEVTKFFYDLVDQTIEFREKQGLIRPDMIHLLLEARKAVDRGHKSNCVSSLLTNKAIASQAMIFSFAGIDTVSTTVSFIAYELGKNPDIQSSLREEIQQTFSDCDGRLTYEKLLEMKYIDMVISEGMRKWTILPVIDRVCTKPYKIEPTSTNEKPVLIEKGDIIWLPIYSIQNDPKYFPDPENFDPERFSEENKEKMNTYSYMPFGQGPRKCIGLRLALMEMKLLFFYLLLNFEIVPVDKTKIPFKLDMYITTMYVGHGLWFGLKNLKK